MVWSLLSTYAHGQKTNASKQISVKDGIYLSVEAFKSNQPDYKLPKEKYRDDKSLNAFKAHTIVVYEKEDTLAIPANQVMFIAFNDNVYINHQTFTFHKNDWHYNTFFKFFRMGQFCRYYKVTGKIVNVEKLNTVGLGLFFYTGMGFYATEVQLPGSGYEEYVFHMETSRVYSLHGGQRKIKWLIQQDPRFAEQKIKNKELSIVISQFNQKNPLSL